VGRACRRGGKSARSRERCGDRRALSRLVERTPLIIAVGAKVAAGHKIRESEQVMSAGAAAMNMLNAVHLLGYGGMWVTGLNAYDPKINALLGFEAPSQLVGFLAVGTPRPTPKDAPKPTRPPRAEHTAEWMG